MEFLFVDNKTDISLKNFFMFKHSKELLEGRQKGRMSKGRRSEERISKGRISEGRMSKGTIFIHIFCILNSTFFPRVNLPIWADHAFSADLSLGNTDFEKLQYWKMWATASWISQTIPCHNIYFHIIKLKVYLVIWDRYFPKKQARL